VVGSSSPLLLFLYVYFQRKAEKRHGPISSLPLLRPTTRGLIFEKKEKHFAFRFSLFFIFFLLFTGVCEFQEIFFPPPLLSFFPSSCPSRELGFPLYFGRVEFKREDANLHIHLFFSSFFPLFLSLFWDDAEIAEKISPPFFFFLLQRQNSKAEVTELFPFPSRLHPMMYRSLPKEKGFPPSSLSLLPIPASKKIPQRR